MSDQAVSLEQALAQADEAERAGRLSDALSQWADIRARYPDHPAAYIKAGDVLLRLQRLDEAAALFGEIHRRDRDNLWPLHRLHNVAFMEGKWTKAIGLAAEMLMRFPDDWVGHCIMADSVERAGDPEQAGRLFALARVRFPGLQPVDEAVARFAERRQDWPLAESCWMAVAEVSSDWRPYLAAANAAIAQGHRADAARIMDAARARHGDNPDLMLATAQLTERVADDAAALAAWRAYRARFPDDWRGAHGVGRALLGQDLLADAEDLLSQACEAFPHVAALLAAHADVAARRGEASQALRRRLLLCERCPDDAPGYMAAADQLMDMERFAEADALLSDAVERRPEEYWLWHRYATVASLRADRPEAIERWHRASVRFPQEMILWHCYGTALREAGEFDAAAAAQERALALQPNHLPSLIERIEALAALRRWDDLVPNWQTLGQHDDHDPKHWLELSCRLYVLAMGTPHADRFLAALLCGRPPDDNPAAVATLLLYLQPIAARPQVVADVRRIRDSLPVDAIHPDTRPGLCWLLNEAMPPGMTDSIFARWATRLAGEMGQLSMLSWATLRNLKIGPLLLTNPSTEAGAATARCFVESVTRDRTRRSGEEWLTALHVAAVTDTAALYRLVGSIAAVVPDAPAPVTAGDTAAMIATRIADRSLLTPALARLPARLTIAVCVSGQMRGYTKAFPTWQNLGLDGHDVYFVVHTWKRIGRKYFLEQLSRSFDPPLDTILHDIVSEAGHGFFQARYSRLCAVAQQSREVSEAMLRDFYQTDLVVVEDDVAGMMRNRSNSWKMHRKIADCHAFAVSEGRPADLYMRIRGDAELAADGPEDWDAIFRETLGGRSIFADEPYRLVPKLGCRIGDLLAVGGREAMDGYAAAFADTEAAAEGAVYGFPRAHHPHSNLAYATLYHGVIVKPFQHLRVASLLDPDKLPLDAIAAAIREDIGPSPRDAYDRRLLDALETMT